MAAVAAQTYLWVAAHDIYGRHNEQTKWYARRLIPYIVQSCCSSYLLPFRSARWRTTGGSGVFWPLVSYENLNYLPFRFYFTSVILWIPFILSRSSRDSSCVDPTNRVRWQVSDLSSSLSHTHKFYFTSRHNALQSIWPLVDMAPGRYGPLSVYMTHQDGRYGPPLVNMAHPLSILLRQWSHVYVI